MNKLIFLFCANVIICCFAKELTKTGPAQTIGVRGNLKCNGKPAGRVLVKLYDHDSKLLLLTLSQLALVKPKLGCKTIVWSQRETFDSRNENYFILLIFVRKSH